MELKRFYESIISGKIETNNPKYVTVSYYKYLLEAEKTLNDIKIDGKIFI